MRQNLQVVTGRIVEVHSSTSVVRVVGAGGRLVGIGPVFQPVLNHPTVYLIEVFLGDEERVVLRLDIDARLGEQDAPVVVELHDTERPPGLSLGQSEKPREE